jgi:hypothetical protein
MANAAWKSNRTARVLTARRHGRCAESGMPFTAGESILWIPPTRGGLPGTCYRLESATAVAWFDDNAPSFDVPADAFDAEWEDRCADACGL